MEKENLPQKIDIASKEAMRISLKLQLSLMGPLGVIIDELIFGIPEKIKNRRIERFIHELDNSIKLINEKSIDRGFLKTEEFFDLLKDTISQSIKTRHNEKIGLFAKVLAGSLKFDRDTESLEDCVQILSSLSLRDIFVLKGIIVYEKNIGIEKLNSDQSENFINAKKLLANGNIPESEVKFSLRKLATLGLIEEYYTTTFGGTHGGDFLSTEKMESIINLIN